MRNAERVRAAVRACVARAPTYSGCERARVCSAGVCVRACVLVCARACLCVFACVCVCVCVCVLARVRVACGACA